MFAAADPQIPFVVENKKRIAGFLPLGDRGAGNLRNAAGCGDKNSFTLAKLSIDKFKCCHCFVCCAGHLVWLAACLEIKDTE